MRFDLQEVLADKALLLLDFDGPVCSVFAGYPAATIAAELVAGIHRFDPSLAVSLQDETDPMQVLRVAAANLPRKTVNWVDELFCSAEQRAVESAEATPGIGELMREVHGDGKKIGIVSNNCPKAIAQYLSRQGLDSNLSVVVGRPFGRPRRMKPDPYLLLQALGATGVDPHQACFVGDSVTDIEAGNSVGVMTVGFANRPGKAALLTDAGASLIVTEF